MRSALAALTLRGRAFLAAGATAVACAMALDQPPLIRVGALLLVVPLLSTMLVGRARHRLALVRTVSPPVVGVGQPAEVTVDLVNEGRGHTGVLLLEEQVPYALGSRPRFVIDGLPRGWRRTVTYQVRSEVRGHFQVGPMAVRVTDPFGMVELGRSFRSSRPLIVTPRTAALPTVSLSGAWSGSGDNRPRAFATGSAEDVTVREYRTGDDLRRVHWRSSARAGELMVRREEQPWQSRATLFLDNRARSHRGQGSGSSFETAVSAIASIALHLSERGYALRLVTAAGEEPAARWHHRDAGANTALLLEELAVIALTDRPQVETGWITEGGHGGLLVAVLGAVDGADQPLLRQMQSHAGNALALVLDVPAWGRSPGDRSEDHAAVGTSALSALGWRCARVGPETTLPQAWEDLGRASRGRRAAAR